MHTLTNSQVRKLSVAALAVFGLLFLFSSPAFMTSALSFPNNRTTSCSSGCVYIAMDNTTEPLVNVVSGQSLVASIKLPSGSEPFGVLYDSNVKEVFVANYGLSEIQVINPSTDKIVKTIKNVVGAAFMTLDTKNGLIFASEFGEYKVAIINATSYKIIKTVKVCGEYPEFLAYNSADGNVYVPARTACYSYIGGSTYKVTNVDLGTEPTGVAVNQENGYVYISDFGANETYVVSGSTTKYTLKSTNFDGRIWGVFYSPTTEDIYVVNTGASAAPFPIGKVIPINSTESVLSPITVGQGPDYGCYLSTSTDVLVTNTHGGVPGNATLINSSNKVVGTIVLGKSSSTPYGCDES